MLVGIVRVALQRPYTFIVVALLLLGIGPLAALRTPTDIFPEIKIPVIAVAWQYTGLPPQEMGGRISTLFQRSLTTTVNDIEHIEATSYAASASSRSSSSPASTWPSRMRRSPPLPRSPSGRCRRASRRR